MSKRRREEKDTPAPAPSSRARPDWLADCPLPDEQLFSFLDYLDTRGWGIMGTWIFNSPHLGGAAGHLVQPTLVTGYKGRVERIACATCVTKCDCCGTACDDLYDYNGDTSKHEHVCYWCWTGHRQCYCEETEK